MGVLKIIGLQAALVLLAAIICVPFNPLWVPSILLGGLVSIIPTLYFAWRFFASVKRGQLKYILRALYLGEFVKLLIVAVLSAVVVSFLKVNILSFMIGFVVSYLAFWIVPIWFCQQRVVST